MWDLGGQWLSGRMLDSRRRVLQVQVSPASMCCVLGQDKHTNPCFVLVQPRKLSPDITEKLLTEM